MYKAAITRGVDLTLHDSGNEGEIWDIYVKLVYLAYRNALDVAAFDGKPAPECEFGLADFQDWAAGEGKARFGRLMRDIVYLKTGRTLEDLAAESGKKKAKRHETSRFLSRGSRGGTGS